MVCGMYALTLAEYIAGRGSKYMSRFNTAGERNRDSETDVLPIPKNEPGPDNPEPEDETQELVRPVKT